MLENIIDRLKEKEIKVYSSGPTSAERINNVSKILEIELPESFKNGVVKATKRKQEWTVLNGL